MDGGASATCKRLRAGFLTEIPTLAIELLSENTEAFWDVLREVLHTIDLTFQQSIL